jgi:hypothetical protein
VIDEADPGCRQYLRPTGAQPSAPGARNVRLGANAAVEVFYDRELGRRGREIADVVLARGSTDLDTISAIFQGVRPATLPVRVILARTPDSARAYHDRCGELEIHCDVETVPAPQPLYSCFLLASQLTEVVAAAHGQGWAGDTAHGEALSRTVAASLYPRRLGGFATAAAWLRGARRDFVNSSTPGDSDAEAIGCCVLFLHYLHTELDLSWAQIVAAGAPTLAATYRRLTGNMDDPFPAFAGQLETAMPRGIAFTLTGDNPYPLPAATHRNGPETSLPDAPAPGGHPAEPLTVPGGAGPPSAPAPAIAADEPGRSAEPARRRPRLEDLLAHRRWWTCDTPFRHLRVDDVFRPDVYAGLERDFLARIEGDELKRNLPGYDASALGLTAETAGAFDIFLTRQWHDLIAGVFGLPATGEVIATLHHHAAGSRSGTPHNDLNPGWFPAAPVLGSDEVRVHDPARCNYRTGHSLTGQPTRERVRGVTVLYYLATPTDVRGGGTGLYRSARQEVERPDVVVAPRNNSLMAFECTPYSFHSFIANHGRPRNCLAMWLHRSLDDVVGRWGRASIVEWT